jgi:phytoene synthase
MDPNTGDHEIDRQVCREQVEKAAHPYRFTQVFAPQEQRARWLGIYALASAWERLVRESSEQEVALRKLEWWRYQCLGQGFENSRHPVIRWLVHSGTADRLARKDVAACLDHAQVRIAADPIDDTNALRDLCLSISRTQASLEAGLFDVPDVPVSAAFGLAQLIRESSGPSCGNRFWWVPLNTLAKHGLGRTMLSEQRETPPVMALFGELSESVSAESEDVSGSQSPELHFHLVAHWSARQIKRLGGRQPQSIERAERTVGASDFFSCWAKARSLRRAALKVRPC